MCKLNKEIITTYIFLHYIPELSYTNDENKLEFKLPATFCQDGNIHYQIKQNFIRVLFLITN